MNPEKVKNKIGFVYHLFGDSQSCKSHLTQLKIVISGVCKISKGTVQQGQKHVIALGISLAMNKPSSK